MQNYKYQTQGTCSKLITFGIEDGKLHNIVFFGGCNGNLKMLGKLLEGADAQEAMLKLKGNECGTKGTSCADQLSKAIEQALNS